MTLSILCVTNNEHRYTTRFICQLHTLAGKLGAEFVLGLDREKAQSAPWRDLANKTIDLNAVNLQEDVLDQAIAACSGDWVLRLDDDETVSPSMEHFLRTGFHKLTSYYSLYAFPRVYLYPDKRHFLTNPYMWPDLQTRLGKKELMYGCNYVHAGNPHGTGQVVPCAIEHHNLLVKTLDERRAIAARYEALRPGAGSLPEYARYNLPEDFYPEFEIKEYTNNGNFASA